MEQQAEKKRIMSERLADARVKGLLEELDQQETDELEQFKKEQERQREEKLMEMQAEAVEMEKMLEEELEKLEQLKSNVAALSRGPSPQVTPTSRAAIAPRGLANDL